MSCVHCRELDRRTLIALLGIGAFGALAGCAQASAPAKAASKAARAVAPTPAVHHTPKPPATAPPIPRAVPGVPEVFFEGPASARAARQVAITIDDGYCAPCAGAYVTLAEQTGLHITFSPNGCYQQIWNPLAETLRPLIDSGQVQIGNHTYNHPDLRRLTESEIRVEFERNEDWVQRTFGTTTRPWWRPPYGFHDSRTDQIAASLGHTNVLMWNGTYGDSAALTPDVLLAQARTYLGPGVIMLGHANHPTVTKLFSAIQEIINSRNLKPVTLDEMFGTNRRTGRAV
jgi:peptidoglycan/xylan/chitin deacetylase (PgdA/CDA1 family)